ncbi:MAG: hypothetical protein AAGG55_09170 [Pseudomonadota bacterium]
MSDPWMDHPKLVAWFDDLEDAVTTAFVFSDEQRAAVKALRAPRDNTWVMLARDTQSRDALREQMRVALQSQDVPIARDCHVLESRDFSLEPDTFEQDNGFRAIDMDYLEEGSAEALRRELLSDAEDYASSDETGWFYTHMDSEQDASDDDPL